MNIGIDLDGVIQNVYKFITEEGISYCKQNNIEVKINNNAYYIQDIFGWDKETTKDFWLKKQFVYAKEGEVLPKASENIKKLKHDSHNIIIITSRSIVDKDLHKELYDNMKLQVKEWLDRNEIIFDNIIFTGMDKSNNIIENNIDVMIEDSPKNLEQLSKITKMICVDWPYNKDINMDNILRCYNWDEIYEKICELNGGKQ